MAEETRLIVIVLAMAAVTYLPRSLPLHFDVRNWPAWIRESIDYLPVSIIAAIVASSLLAHDGRGWFARPTELIAAAACAYRTRNLLASVVLGTGAYLLLT